MNSEPLPMLAVMGYRGHAWERSCEMAAAVFLPALVLVFFWLGLVTAHLVTPLQMLVMVPVMLGVMLYRAEHPRGTHGRRSGLLGRFRGRQERRGSAMWFRHGFFFGGSMMLCWAMVVVLLAALTTWWVLFALAPLAMMMSGMAMRSTMARSAEGEPRAGPWAWCSAWFAPAGRKEV